MTSWGKRLGPFLVALSVFGVQCVWAQDTPIGAAPNPDIEVLARGPVHEAYAQPALNGSVEMLTVPKQPPEAIEEVPPEVRPEGDHVGWIPGYWAWDDDRQDFIWVSGVWRVAPVGSQWVSGYWVSEGSGYRWVPGFWSKTETEEVAYYPPPPQTLEQGPTGPAPSGDQFWVPGCWIWRDVRYAWRPGYWAQAYPNWLWVPASYYWAPSGWVFVDGYWDYPLSRRGLLFAPVYFERGIYRQPRFRYTPYNVVDAGLLTLHFFARPHYGHYYFGDYYAPSYSRYGIYPWYSFRDHRDYAYDPLYSYYRWYHGRSDSRWEANLRGWHEYYREHEDLRPAHTYVAQQRVRQEHRDRRDINNVVTVQSVQEVKQRTDSPIRLTDLNEPQRKAALVQSQEMRQFARERQTIEKKLVQSAPKAETADVARGTLGAGRDAAKLSAGGTPFSASADRRRSPASQAPQVAGCRRCGGEGSIGGHPRTIARRAGCPEGDPIEGTEGRGRTGRSDSA